jgi:hypothetical protein
MSYFTGSTGTVSDYQTFAQNLDAGIASARRRNALNLTVSLVSLGLLGFWLTTAYSKFRTIDPEFATGFVASEVEARLPRAGQMVEQRLIQMAPELVASAEKRLTKLPDAIAAKLKARTDAELEQALPQLEEELYQSLKLVLADAATTAGKGADDPVAAKHLIDSVADAYQTETLALIDTVYQRYNAVGGDALAYLDYLAENKDLDKTEQLHREMLTTFLTIAARQQIAAAEPVTPVPPVESADDR